MDRDDECVAEMRVIGKISRKPTPTTV